MSSQTMQSSEAEVAWKEVVLFELKARNIINFNYYFQRVPGKDKIPLAELKNLLGDVGLDLPDYQIREILNKLRHDTKAENVTKAQFIKVGHKNDLNNP